MSESQEKTGITDAFTEAMKTGDFSTLNEKLNSLADTAIEAAGSFISSGTEAVQKYSDSQEEKQKRRLEAKRKRELSPMTSSPAGTVSGPVLLICGIIILLSCAAGVMTAYTLGHMTAGLFFLLVPVALSFYMILKGFSLNHRVALFREFREVMHGEPYVSMKELSEASGLSDRKTYKAVKEFIEIKYFPKGQLIYKDHYLILSPGAKEYLDRHLAEVRKKQEREEQEAKLSKKYPSLKAASDAIDATIGTLRATQRSRTAKSNEEFNAQLEALEKTLGHINEYILQNPENIPNMKSFLDYFLPTVDKLLTTYNTLDAQKLQTETIKQSKKEIEETLGSVEYAFRKMYDGFFQNTALDVSSDISVMNTMFARNGLQNPDFKDK